MYKLKNLVVIFRHGAREPTNKKDTVHQCLYKSWDKKKANLTEIGKRQSQILGETLAKHYKRLGFNPHKTYADNSNTQRTIMSKHYFLSGWRYIYYNDITTIEKTNPDIFLRPYRLLKNCHHKTPQLTSCLTYHGTYTRDRDQCDINSSNREIDQLNSIINEELKDQCGIDHHNNSFEKLMFKLYQNRLINGASYKHGIFWNKNQPIVDNYAYLYLNNKYRDPHINCLASGTIPSNIIDWLSSKNSSAYFMFSHDNLLASLLSYLGLREWPIPGFNAYLGFELWENKRGKKIVKIFYNPDPFYGNEMKVSTNKMFNFVPPPPGHTISYRNISPRYIEWFQFLKLMKRCLLDGEYVMYDGKNIRMASNSCNLYKEI